MKLLLAHPEKCTGCRICELVCSYKHYGVNNPKKAAIRVTQLFPKPAANVPIVCRQCKVARCIEMCGKLTFNALYKNDAGVTLVDAEKCVGCWACAEACPFAAVYIHKDLNVPIICDQCGGDPECVKHCPTKALEFTAQIATHQTSRIELATKMAGTAEKKTE